MKRFLRMVFGVLLAAALAAGGLAGWALRTQAGRNRLAAEVAHRLSAALGHGVLLRGVTGALPGRGRIAQLRVSDGQADWLVVSNLSWQVSLLEGRRLAPKLHRIEADTVDWLRRPGPSRARARDAESGSVSWQVETARIGALRIQPAVAGLLVEAGVEAAGAMTATGYFVRAHAIADGIALQATLWGSGAEWRVDADAPFTNAALWRAAAGDDAGGAGLLRGEAVRDAQGIRVRAHLDGRDIATRWLSARAVIAEMEAVRGTAGWSGAGTVELAEGRRTNLVVHRLRAAVEGSPASWEARVAQADLALAGEPVVLVEPLVLRGRPAELAWTGMTVQVRGGSMVSDGAWTPTQVNARAQITDWPVDRWLPAGSFLGYGLLSGTVQAGGPPGEPWWSVHAVITGLHPRAERHLALTPATLTLQAIATNRRARAEASLRGWTDDPVRLFAEAPLVATGAWPRLAMDQPARGTLEGVFRLERLQEIMDLRGAAATGALRGELTWAGTLAVPEVRGRVTLRGGGLELPETATVLRDAEVVLEGDRERLVIREAHASDGAGGRLVLEGHLQFRPDLGFPLETALTLQRAELWRPGGSRLRLDGRLAVTGTVQDLVITGAVKAVETEYRLSRRAPRVARLEVEGLDADTDAAMKRAPSRWRAHVRMDVRVTGREMVVAGRGLESQWRADLQVRGTAAAPRLSGGLHVERGYFLFMGRRFALQQGGLTLDGRWPPEPELGLQASTRTADLTARLLASGPVSAPRLELESDPPYPMDEIVSRLLFGKGTDAISALQAVRLAHGLHVLRGKGSTLDVLDRGQSLLRVDQIELQQNEGSAELSSISVGKYIGRSVYVQGEKGLGGAEDVLSVEVELSPSLILQSETSPNIREGVSLQWRRDY
jgi:autotransporter translocation and assembly factor TamB